MGKAGKHCGSTNSVEMDSAGRGTGVGDVEAGVPAMAREMGMLVPAEHGVRGQGRLARRLNSKAGGITDSR